MCVLACVEQGFGYYGVSFFEGMIGETVCQQYQSNLILLASEYTSRQLGIYVPLDAYLLSVISRLLLETYVQSVLDALLLVA